MLTADLIIHSVTVYDVANLDADRNPVYGAGVTMPCRLEPIDARVRSQLGIQNADAMTIYSNSELKAGQRVDWMTKHFTVSNVKACYALDGNAPHHWEGQLI